MDIEQELQRLLGLETVTYRYALTREELFHAALANDRGRVRPEGSDDEPKAHATQLGLDGPLVYYSDPSCTGRPVQDTFCVQWPEIDQRVWWKNDFQPFAAEGFPGLLARVVAHLNARQATLYVQDVFCGVDASFALPYRFVGEYATHAYFAQIMFPKGLSLPETAAEQRWTMLNVPSFHCDPARDGTRSERAVIVDFRQRIGLVLGRADYCGIVKKTMFTVMNFQLPESGDLPMHCSANIGAAGDGAILFGLSGTGKTTLSADPDRQLIGDDEHAWTEAGIFNLEDGCYAKLIDLNKDAEPVIAAALSQPGTLIENVPPLPGKPMEETDPQALDLSDGTITDNTRFAYPLGCNPDVAPGAQGPHPQTIVLLTADAFGVLPPVAVLDEDEVMYHFVSGYTSKLAGTEVGVTEPKATFSACFGSPFMSQQPRVYAELLAAKMRQHRARCILLNTGWSGGPYGTGKRMSIDYTRKLLNAALQGQLDGGQVDYQRHPVFNLRMPLSCPGVPSEILNPRHTWADQAAYDRQAEALRALFRKNFQDKGFDQLGIHAVM